MDGPRSPRARRRDSERGGLAGLALPAFVLASLLLMEFVLRAQTDLPFMGIGLAHAVLFVGAAALLVHLVASFFTGLARDVLIGGFLAIATLLFISQFIYYDIFKTFYTVFSATHAGQATEFGGDVLGKAADNAGWLLLLAARP